jgi:outer membrane protein, heavy metal efflux system
MFISSRPGRWSLPRVALAALVAACCAAQAQPGGDAAAPAPSPLREALAAAWARHAEARSAPLRREAALAQRRVAQAWTPEPAALEASTRTDRFTRNRGARELEIGVAVPLWLPGERSRAMAVADSELAALDSHAAAAQWRLAGAVREAWWALQLARQDVASAQARAAAAQALAADALRRVQAGELARADHNQAEAAVASAAVDVAVAQGHEAAAVQAWRALVGPALPPPGAAVAEAEAEPAASDTAAPAHPALRVWADKAETLRRALALGQVQQRGNPELTLLTTRDRGGVGEPYGQTVTLGVRVPLGSDDRSRAKVAVAAAELAEAEAALAAEQAQLQAQVDAARSRVATSRLALAASVRRAELTRQTQGFIDKSYRAGETDLPSRLRVQAEAAEAARQADRARLELQRAVSAWRQALGLLPD